MVKTYLIVCDRSPYGSVSVQESLDMATAAAAFDLPVQVLLRGDAVYSALASQESGALGQKNLGKLLGALTIYGVNGIFVDGDSLTERGLFANDLVPEAETLEESAINALLAQEALIVQL
jgi:tRNA 2-thiouridine synthesizing protein C